MPFDYRPAFSVETAVSNEQAKTRPLGPEPPLSRLHLRLLALELAFGAVPAFVAGRIRTMAMRAAGLKIGKSSLFFGLPTLLGEGRVEDRFRVGTFCGFNAGSIFDLEDSVTIGDHVAVGHDVMFLTSGSWNAQSGALKRAPIVIENGVWLGARTVVLPGVTVGESSVIGAGVVVDKDVPANTLLAGATKVSIAKWR
ncbi:MAG: acyltransferase [Myxococcales bacterium]